MDRILYITYGYTRTTFIIKKRIPTLMKSLCGLCLQQYNMYATCRCAGLHFRVRNKTIEEKINKTQPLSSIFLHFLVFRIG